MSGDSTTNAFLQRIDEGYYHRQEFIEETWRQHLDSLTPEERRELEAARLAELQNHPPHSPSPPPTDGRILRDSPPFGPSAESCPASPLAHSPAPLDSPITLPTSIHPPMILPPPDVPQSPSLPSPTRSSSPPMHTPYSRSVSPIGPPSPPTVPSPPLPPARPPTPPPPSLTSGLPRPPSPPQLAFLDLPDDYLFHVLVCLRRIPSCESGPHALPQRVEGDAWILGDTLPEEFLSLLTDPNLAIKADRALPWLEDEGVASDLQRYKAWNQYLEAIDAFLAHVHRIRNVRAWELKEIASRLVNAKAPSRLLPLTATPYAFVPTPLPLPDALPPSLPSAPTVASPIPLPIPTPASHLRGGASSPDSDTPALLSRISNRSRRRLRCWLCKKRGHKKGDCPKKQSDEGSSGWPQAKPNVQRYGWNDLLDKEDYGRYFCTGCGINKRSPSAVCWGNCPSAQEKARQQDFANSGPFDYEGNEADDYE